MKVSNTTIKVLVILCSIFSVNLLYGDDEFSVTVTEKVSGPIKEVEICYSIDQDISVFRIPSFDVSSTGVATPTFDVTFNFASPAPPDGRTFRIYGYVYIKNAQNAYIPVALNNAAVGGISVMGNIGTTQGGDVTLSVTPDFNVLSNCSYYFGFSLVDISYQNGGGNGSSVENQESIGANEVSNGENAESMEEEGGTASIAHDFSFSTPRMELTKDIPGCTKYLANICKTVVVGNVTNTNRTSSILSDSNLGIFPNPSREGKVVLRLDFEETKNRNLNIEILNTQGQILRSETAHVMATQSVFQQKLNMQEFPAGIYLIKVHTGDQQLIQKLIIQ